MWLYVYSSPKPGAVIISGRERVILRRGFLPKIRSRILCITALGVILNRSQKTRCAITCCAVLSECSSREQVLRKQWKLLQSKFEYWSAIICKKAKRDGAQRIGSSPLPRYMFNYWGFSHASVWVFGRNPLIRSDLIDKTQLDWASLTLDSCPSRNEIFSARSRKTKILTAGIHWVFWGLKSESDAEIAKNSHLWMGTRLTISVLIVKEISVNWMSGLQWIEWMICKFKGVVYV